MQLWQKSSRPRSGSRNWPVNNFWRCRQLLARAVAIYNKWSVISGSIILFGSDIAVFMFPVSVMQEFSQ